MEGEISNWKPSSTGHIYFTLKDEKSSISAVLFKWKASKLNSTLKDGMKVKVKGGISVYPKSGSYQIVVETIEQTGDGEILLMLEKRKQQLAAEGLFDESIKKPLPKYPKTIGVVTSPTGAALRDILQILRRRNNKISVIIFPCPVQGTDAAPRIAKQIKTANAFNMCDILIVGRGGGSIEDLLPFSEECVVRAIYESKIPVISAVGHEIDWSLSDFVADKRAPTPSAAAELSSTILAETLESLEQYQAELYRAMTGKIDNMKAITKGFSADNMTSYFKHLQNNYIQRLDYANEDLIKNMDSVLQQKKHQFLISKNTLEQVNPLSILKRGFSIVQDGNGNIVKSTEQVNIGQKIKITVSDGQILSEILEKKDGKRR